MDIAGDFVGGTPEENTKEHMKCQRYCPKVVNDRSLGPTVLDHLCHNFAHAAYFRWSCFTAFDKIIQGS